MKWLKALLNPDRKILLIFSLPIGLICFFVNYISAFSWMIPFPTYFFFITLFGCSMVALIVDNLFKTRLIKYSAIFLIMFPISYYAFQPMIPHIKKSTESRGEILCQAIENYKKENGHYPHDLNDPALIDAPKYASIFRPFSYRVYFDENKTPYFEISCISFSGLFGYYYSTSHKWCYAD